MINQFRNLNPINILFLAVYTLFMRIAIFLDLPETLTFDFLEPYTQFFLKLPESSFSPLINIILAAIIVFIQALWFNRIINNHTLMPKPTYIPALIYITGSGLFLQFLVLSPPLICNFLVLLVIDKFLKLAKMPSAMGLMFDVGMIIAIGTLIYFPFIVLFAMLWLSLLLYRPFNWREWLSGIIGFLTIFFFIAVFYYLNDSLNRFLAIWQPLTNKFPTSLQINYKDYLVLIPVSIIIIMAALQLRENFFRSFISTRKAFQMLFFMFLISLISFYTKPGVTVSHFILCVPTGSVLIAYYFVSAQRRWIYESLFAILIICIQYFLFV
ncbi:beta-carotene 15,15'-monooxygenase [Pedobacter sp.]|uniref:beta-carotene 15,15'-monooxygenase n=1 Tax=Pedobacter sp. TaxID=1411316 RepID=UPI00396C5122